MSDNVQTFLSRFTDKEPPAGLAGLDRLIGTLGHDFATDLSLADDFFDNIVQPREFSQPGRSPALPGEPPERPSRSIGVRRYGCDAWL